jgi:glycosyltransferase involved in cell wall biosynthesis
MNSNFKICHITSVHKQNDSRIFHKECKSLAEANFDTTLLVLNGKNEDVDGVKIRSVEWKSTGRLQRIFRSGKAMLPTALALNADIYHLHDPELLFIARKLKQKSGALVVYDSHEDLPKQVLDKYWIPSWIRKFLSFLVYQFEMYVAKKLDGVVSVTETICARFKKVNCHVAFVANYPVLNEMVVLASAENKEKSNSVCYIGGLTPTRGIKELVQALAFTDARLLLAGSFSSEAFEKEVKELPEWQKVSFYGYVNRNEIVEILETAAVGIVTLHPTKSYMEALPIKLFEYMSAKLPVIGSDFVSWRPLILDNNCGFMVDPLQPKEIAERINYLLAHPMEAQKMGVNGYNAVHEKYSWETQALNLIAFYHSILPSKP